MKKAIKKLLAPIVREILKEEKEKQDRITKGLVLSDLGRVLRRY